LTQDIEKELVVHRDEIDKIDQEILSLMNRRIATAKIIGEIKSTLSQPAFYRPEREARVLRRLIALNDGPMDKVALESLFREIMSVTRGIEAGLSVSVLGPAGTFTELAAKRHFGSAVEMVPLATIDEIFRSAESKHTDYAVVPVENSTEGGVSSTLDRTFWETPRTLAQSIWYMPIASLSVSASAGWMCICRGWNWSR